MDQIPPRHTTIDEQEEAVLGDAITAFRVAVTQVRIYPPHSEVVQNALQEALGTLEIYLKRSGSLAISVNAFAIAFNGKILRQRGLQESTRDMQRWMIDWGLETLEFQPGLTLSELIKFLQSVTADDAPAEVGQMQALLGRLNLPHIKTTALPEEVVLTSRGGSGGGSSPGGGGPSRPEPPREKSRVVVLHSGSSATAVNFDALSDEEWEQLFEHSSVKPVESRRQLLTDLSGWLEQDGDRIPSKMLRSLDDFIGEVLLHESDSSGVKTAAHIAKQRLTQLGKQHDRDGILAYLELLHQRLQEEQSSAARLHLEGSLSQALSERDIQEALIRAALHPEHAERVRKMSGAFNERVMRPLIESLRVADTMEERSRIIKLLQLLNGDYQSLLLAELNEANPWFFYRNLLLVLAEVGNEEALAAISDKIGYPDPRVRAAAVTAAVRIAGERGAANMLQGLRDEDASVRTQAATLTSHCPRPEVRDALLALLEGPSPGKSEPDGVLYAACLALGKFRDDAVINALERIANPPLFGRKKSEQVRSAALAALGAHADDPRVERILKRAARSGGAAHRQAAEQALHSRNSHR